jgi:hypothetical protein
MHDFLILKKLSWQNAEPKLGISYRPTLSQASFFAFLTDF